MKPGFDSLGQIFIPVLHFNKQEHYALNKMFIKVLWDLTIEQLQMERQYTARGLMCFWSD